MPKQEGDKWKLNLSDKQKADNAKLKPEAKVRKLINVVKNNVPQGLIPGSEGVDDGTFIFVPLNQCIENHVYLDKQGRAAVDCQMFNKGEKRFIVDVCRALGFEPTW